MVEIFKTKVKSRQYAKRIILELNTVLPTAKINFDLDDCDNILRIENHKDVLNIIENKLIELNCNFELLK